MTSRQFGSSSSSTTDDDIKSAGGIFGLDVDDTNTGNKVVITSGPPVTTIGPPPSTDTSMIEGYLAK